MKRISSNLILALAAIALGVLAGVITAAFLYVVTWGQEFLWDTLTIHLPLQALLVCTVGGLLVGLCQRYLGDYPKSIHQAAKALQQNGRLEYRHLHKGIVTAFTSLAFGASLGPEAAIVDLSGGLMTWAGDIMQKLRTGLHLPQRPQDSSRFDKILRNWTVIIALAAFLYTAVYFLSGLYGGGLLAPGVTFHWTDLLWSIPMGLVGVATGWLYLFFQNQSERLAAPLHNRPVLRSLVGGFALGLAALFLPMVLFSGQHQLQPAYDQALQLGFWVLFLTGLARLFLTSLMLATGWKGGQFLPVMFAASVLGLSLTMLVTSMPHSVAALATMAGLLAVILPRPVVSLAMMLLMFPFQYAAICAVAVAVAAPAIYLGKQLTLTSQSCEPLPVRLDGQA